MPAALKVPARGADDQVMRKRPITLGTQPLPVLAISDAVILGSDSHDGGWPGGHLTDGT